jgi:ribosomal protein S18 acetylase RimI-like enzyme
MPSWVLDSTGALRLREVTDDDIRPAAVVAGRAFGDTETERLVESMLRLYRGRAPGIAGPPPRAQAALAASYYVLLAGQSAGERIIGLTGLYRPVWAGLGIFWLGWFAIDPDAQGRGHGRRLLQASLRLAVTFGGRRLCVETGSDLLPALRLYAAAGFEEHGRIADYWRAHSDLVIVSRSLDDIEPLPPADTSG